MQGAVNYARGWAAVTVTGPFPERLLNLCAQRGIVFWAVEWLGEQELRLKVMRRHLSRMQALAPRAGCETRVERRVGLPDALIRLRHRYAFWVGLFVTVLAVSVASSFILNVDIQGNQRVPDAVILAQLRRQGLRPGVFGPALDSRVIARETLWALEELEWVTINIYGTRAQVQVAEKVDAPPRLEQEGLSDICAAADGLILRIDTVSGQAKVAPGDTVTRGQVLISGTVTMDGPQYSGLPPHYLHVRADGQVWARTWRTLSAAIPLQTTGKRYTGQEKSSWSLTVFERRINFYGKGSISWDSYDKIRKVYPLTLPGGQTLPVRVERERLSRWEPETLAVDPSAAQKLLEEQLHRRLEQLVGEKGEVVRVTWSARIADGQLTVTGTAECKEQLGRPTQPQFIGGQPSAG